MPVPGLVCPGRQGNGCQTSTGSTYMHTIHLRKQYTRSYDHSLQPYVPLLQMPAGKTYGSPSDTSCKMPETVYKLVHHELNNTSSWPRLTDLQPDQN
jgi:hypothetical protein